MRWPARLVSGLKGPVGQIDKREEAKMTRFSKTLGLAPLDGISAKSKC